VLPRRQQPRARRRPHGHEVLQKLKEPGLCRPLRILQRRRLLPLPLLLLLLLALPPALLDALLVPLLVGQQGRRLQQGGDAPLPPVCPLALLLPRLLLLLPPLLLSLLGCRATRRASAHIHGTHSRQAHHTPDTGMQCGASPASRRVHAQDMVSCEGLGAPRRGQLPLDSRHHGLRHRALPKMMQAPDEGLSSSEDGLLPHRRKHTLSPWLACRHIPSGCRGGKLGHKVQHGAATRSRQRPELQLRCHLDSRRRRRQ
jgi:hypothetical protein